jgi:hypothetical protein
MRLSLILAGLLTAMCITKMSAADFPEPGKLPANSELPDPLVMLNGQRVQSREQWFQERRPELKALFQHYMYGELPHFRFRMGAQYDYEDPKAFGGKATLKEVSIRVGGKAPQIYLLLVIPNQRKGPVPAFVGTNFCGNHALVDDPKVHIPEGWMYPQYPGVKNNRATEGGRGKQKDVWALEQSIDRGYAVATFYNGDIDPDQKDKREGMQPFFAGNGAKPATIAAWVWGIQQAVDFLLTQKELDPKRIAVVGHSRLGKTALLAAAFDERIALAIPHQAGCGGTAPSRCHNPKAETIKRINTSFPHWFNDNFKKFNDSPDKLPFDQNCLVALVAPRPVLFSNAIEDEWANPAGQFEVLKAADPVYRFLGAGGLDAKEMPEPGKLVDSTLGYYIRPGKHSMTREDWKVFLDFADKNLPKPN